MINYETDSRQCFIWYLWQLKLFWLCIFFALGVWVPNLTLCIICITNLSFIIHWTSAWVSGVSGWKGEVRRIKERQWLPLSLSSLLWPPPSKLSCPLTPKEGFIHVFALIEHSFSTGIFTLSGESYHDVIYYLHFYLC